MLFIFFIKIFTFCRETSDREVNDHGFPRSVGDKTSNTPTDELNDVDETEPSIEDLNVSNLGDGEKPMQVTICLQIVNLDFNFGLCAGLIKNKY